MRSASVTAGERLLEHAVDAAPECADRAVGGVNAVAKLAWMGLAERFGEELAAEHFERFPDRDVAGRSHQPIAAARAARAPNEVALAKHAHELCHVLRGHALGVRDLLNADRLSGLVPGEPEQTAEPVFLLGRQPHARVYKKSIPTSQHFLPRYSVAFPGLRLGIGAWKASPTWPGSSCSWSSVGGAVEPRPRAARDLF